MDVENVNWIKVAPMCIASQRLGVYIVCLNAAPRSAKEAARKSDQDTEVCSPNFTEWAISEFFDVDIDKHTVKTYGSVDALINNTVSIDAARYLVSSVLIPWKDPSNPERTFRVAGDTMTWRQLVDTLGEVQGAVYKHEYLDPAVAQKNEDAREAGDFGAEMAWSAKPLAASGHSIVGAPLDNAQLDFKPETVKETLQRLYSKK